MFRKKRIILPLLTLLLAGSAAILAVWRSDTSSIVFYNMTGEALPPLRMEACGEVRTYSAIPEEGSVRWKLSSSGTGSPVKIELARDPAWRWQGSYIEPNGGQMVTLRLWPGGQVEDHHQVSFWQRALGNVPGMGE